MSHACSFSAIIPVYNEEERINETIARLYGVCGSDGVEVIIVDGDPAGGTLQAAADRRVVKCLSAKGRARQMNAGASLASGDMLVFLHADTQLPPQALSRMADVASDRLLVGGAFDLAIDAPGLAFRLIERMASFRSRLTGVPYGDQAIFLRRGYFRSVGGYREIPLMEDVDLMRRIKKKGGRIRILPDRVVTSARRWQKEGVLHCTLRNWSIVTLYLLGVTPERLVRFYR